jgi:hypothetical protein
LILIVAGVLIALALDSWREGRQDRQQEVAYLEQLLFDLHETRERLAASIEGDSATLATVSRVVERAIAGPLPPLDSLELPTGFSQFRPLTGTQAALVQSGDLRLLRSDSIRFELIAYAALIDATETILRHTEDLIWNSTERVILGRARYSRRMASPGDGAGEWGSIDAAGILGDPEVISALQVQGCCSGWFYSAP